MPNQVGSSSSASSWNPTTTIPGAPATNGASTGKDPAAGAPAGPATAQSAAQDQFFVFSSHGGNLLDRLHAARQRAATLENRPLSKKQRKKKRGGLFKRLGRGLEALGKKIGGALEKIGKVFLKIAPILFAVMMLVPGLNVIGVIGLAALAAYKGIVEKDWVGAALAIAGAVTAGAAAAAGSAVSVAAQTAARVAQYARAAQSALKAFQAAKSGNWVGALAGAAGAVAGGVGDAAEGLSRTLEQASAWAKRVETAARALKAAKSGDYFQAIGIGASLAGDLTHDAEVRAALEKIESGASGLLATSRALESGDYWAAAVAFSATASKVSDEEHGEKIGQFAVALNRVAHTHKAIQVRDYGLAAATLTLAGSTYVGCDDTRGQLEDAAMTLAYVDGALEATKAGDWQTAGRKIAAALERLLDESTRNELEDARKEVEQSHKQEPPVPPHLAQSA